MFSNYWWIYLAIMFPTAGLQIHSIRLLQDIPSSSLYSEQNCKQASKVSPFLSSTPINRFSNTYKVTSSFVGLLPFPQVALITSLLMILASLKERIGQECPEGDSSSIVLRFSILLWREFFEILSPTYFDIWTYVLEQHQISQSLTFLQMGFGKNNRSVVGQLCYNQSLMKLYLVGALLLLIPALKGAQLVVESNITQTDAVNKSQSNLNEFQIAEQEIKHNLNKLQSQQNALSSAVDTLNSIKNDLNATISKYTQPDVQEQYKEFFMEVLSLILENIILLVVITIIAIILLYFLITYLLRRRTNNKTPGLHKINQIYTESQHSSSTNLESISQRSNTEPTL